MRTVDERPSLRLAGATWEREDEAGRQVLVLNAARLGFRLVVVAEDGSEWSPEWTPEEWTDRLSA